MITEEMLARSRAIQPSVEWTNYVRSQYSPAADSKVVVAWDTPVSYTHLTLPTNREV